MYFDSFKEHYVLNERGRESKCFLLNVTYAREKKSQPFHNACDNILHPTPTSRILMGSYSYLDPRPYDRHLNFWNYELKSYMIQPDHIDGYAVMVSTSTTQLVLCAFSAGGSCHPPLYNWFYESCKRIPATLKISLTILQVGCLPT